MSLYEIRLIEGGKPRRIVTFAAQNDQCAKHVILRIDETYDRYELWRGIELVDAGGRFIICNAGGSGDDNRFVRHALN